MSAHRSSKVPSGSFGARKAASLWGRAQKAGGGLKAPCQSTKSCLERAGRFGGSSRQKARRREQQMAVEAAGTD